MDRQREARKREPANMQTKKGKKDEHLKLSNISRTILFYKNYKKKIVKEKKCSNFISGIYGNLMKLNFHILN